MHKSTSIFLLFLLTGCIENFDLPTVLNGERRTLVVDGSITDQEGPYTVKLTNTKPLSADTIAQVETGATVIIEEENGTSVTLVEILPGVYQTSPNEIRGEIGKSYRLSIRLFDGLEYQSTWELIRRTPEIDEIRYDLSSENGQGAQLYIDTQDKLGLSSFFRWDIEEVWKYEAPLVSDLIFESLGVTSDKSVEDIHRICWKQSKVIDIMLSSVSDLSQSSIQNHPLAFIGSDSARFDIRYSALIKQYVIGLQEFNFWKGLRDTNVNIGSIYDNQPYHVEGNIKNTLNAQTEAFGYFRANAVIEKRIFINRSEFPRASRPDPAFSDCVIFDHERKCVPGQTVSECSRVHEEKLLELIRVGARIFYAEPYFFTNQVCGDCEKYGGSTVQPTYWKE